VIALLVRGVCGAKKRQSSSQVKDVIVGFGAKCERKKKTRSHRRLFVHDKIIQICILFQQQKTASHESNRRAPPTMIEEVRRSLPVLAPPLDCTQVDSDKTVSKSSPAAVTPQFDSEDTRFVFGHTVLPFCR